MAKRAEQGWTSEGEIRTFMAPTTHRWVDLAVPGGGTLRVAGKDWNILCQDQAAFRREQGYAPPRIMIVPLSAGQLVTA